nr:MAG TPA: hypothetical protein [Caudoviricetes sp.]
MTPLVVGEDFSKLPPSMEYIFALYLDCGRSFNEAGIL